MIMEYGSLPVIIPGHYKVGYTPMGLEVENWELHSLYVHVLKHGWNVVEQTHNHGKIHFWVVDPEGRRKVSLTLYPVEKIT